MKSFLKLVNFELNRFMKLYIILLTIIFGLQLSTTIFVAKDYMRKVMEMTRNGMSQTEIITNYSTFGLLDVTYSVGFTAPIVIGVAALLFYMFFIWYRDWFARTTFIYRLLTLPTSRMNVFFAKLTTIMLTIFGMIALQLIVLQLLQTIVKWIVPVSYRIDTSLMDTILGSAYLNILYPDSFIMFLIVYILGLSFVIVTFTMILLERSFRLKGIVFGVGYFLICIFVNLLPTLIQVITNTFYLYPNEFFFVQLFILILTIGISLWLSRYIINHKITV